MKRLISGITALLLCASLACGCENGEALTDVASDLAEFRDVEMAPITELYSQLKAEVAMWNGFTEPEQLTESINSVILPNIVETLRQLEAVEVVTEEVKELKEMLVSGMEKYKRGYAGVLAGFDSMDEAAVTAAYAILEEGEAAIGLFYEKLDTLSEKYQLDTEEGETK